MSKSLNVKILTARKGYEFTLDDLRLTMFGAEPVYAPIKEAFYFQAHGLASPPPTFGPVTPTIPPGLIFQMGMWVAEDKTIVPIRFLHIESSRIVIDVAGPSAAADAIFQRLLDITSDLAAPDGSPLIGQPVRTLNFSELSIQHNGALENLFAPAVRELFAASARESSQESNTRLLPSIQFQASSPDSPFDGQINTGNGRTFSLSLRAGSSLDEHAIYSSAPLETDAHLRFLEALSALMA